MRAFGWLPGIYESKKAARYAFRFSVEVLEELQEAANKTESRVITFEALQEARRKLNAL